MQKHYHNRCRSCVKWKLLLSSTNHYLYHTGFQFGHAAFAILPKCQMRGKKKGQMSYNTFPNLLFPSLPCAWVGYRTRPREGPLRHMWNPKNTSLYSLAVSTTTVWCALDPGTSAWILIIPMAKTTVLPVVCFGWHWTGNWKWNFLYHEKIIWGHWSLSRQL